MPNRIVALVDCSSSLESVCDYAARIASESGSPIKVLHVHEDARLRDRQALGVALMLGGHAALIAELEGVVAPRDRESRVRGMDLLDLARRHLRRKGFASSASLRSGDAASIAAEYAAGATFVIAPPSDTRASSGQRTFGGTARKLLRGKRCDVIVVPQRNRPIRRALVMCEGGTSSDRVLDHVLASPAFRNLAVTIVGFHHGTNCLGERLRDVEERATRAPLADLRLVSAAQNMDACEGSDLEGADIIVASASRESRLRRRLRGISTSTIFGLGVPAMLTA